MKTYLVYLLVCSSLNATDCKPLTLMSVSGAHTPSQAVQKAVELATDCTSIQSMCTRGIIKLDKVELAP